MTSLVADVASLVPTNGVTSTVALVGAAGVAVGAGVLAVNTDNAPGAAADMAAAPSADVSDALRQHVAAGDTGGVSRSVARQPLVSVQRADKAAAMPASRQNVAGAITETVAATDPRDIAMAMLADYGWSSDQFACLDQLYMRESGWNPSAANPYSGAFGIPQALPGDKMASAGADWQTNPATQLEWGLSYIQDRYGSPCGAWAFSESNGFY
ncbi:MAG TPA: lytic transglycosylase domain-containing protein [Nocardioidaceae bacterium]|nr:lytic transglycosylase domain-containing protein [Nocardioidaceae bacterium]